MKSIRANFVRGLNVLIVAFFISSASHASGVSHLVVFGDSLSDNGNLLAQTGGLFPTNPTYWQGRQTNGMVWAETLAMDIGACYRSPQACARAHARRPGGGHQSP